MRKIASIAAAAATLLCATAANAASLVFDFDEANSSFTATSTTPWCAFGGPNGCKLSTTLYNPISNLEIEEGDSATFAFGKLSVGPGIGGDLDGQVSAVLAFLTPAGSGSAGSGANVAYATVFGLVSGGFLTWSNPVHHLTAADGSTFTVTFQNLSGVKFGNSVDALAKITVNDVAAIPEPATWALMIGGFGLAGTALRRRRAALAA